MTRNEILAKVMSRMDEVSEFSSGQNVVNYQVEKELDDAAVELVSILPVHMAFPVSATPSLSGGYIECPSDFLRLSTLALSSWDKKVTSCALPGDIRESYQMYDYLASDTKNPLAVLYNTAAGNYRIKVYPSEDGEYEDSLDEFTYVQRPSAAEDLDDALMDMFSWLCAARVYRVHGEPELAAICEEKTVSIIKSEAEK